MVSNEELDRMVAAGSKEHPYLKPCRCKAMPVKHYVMVVYGVTADQARSRGMEWHPVPPNLGGGTGWAVACD